MANVKMTDAVRDQVLGAIRAGLHPDQACVAVGLGPRYLRRLRQVQSETPSAQTQTFLDAVSTAVALAELDDVLTTKRAAKIEPAKLVCPSCKEPFDGDPVLLANVLGAVESGQRVKASAASVAMSRLERRFSQRWSQRVVHTVQEEHERLLDVCERILAPEVFELLLDEYLASDGGEGEAAEGQAEPPSGESH